MTDLDLLAETLGVNARTLRRAAGRGTIRIRRRGERRIELPSQERLYLESRWPLIHTLVGELRTIPNVRMAVLFGSVARGDETGRSDIDLLVRLRRTGIQGRSHLVGRLEALAGRRVQIVEVADASPLLLVDVLRDGRVLVDRDGDWRALERGRKKLELRAHAARNELDAALADDLEELLAKAGE